MNMLLMVRTDGVFSSQPLTMILGLWWAQYSFTRKSEVQYFAGCQVRVCHKALCCFDFDTRWRTSKAQGFLGEAFSVQTTLLVHGTDSVPHTPKR